MVNWLQNDCLLFGLGGETVCSTFRTDWETSSHPLENFRLLIFAVFPAVSWSKSWHGCVEDPKIDPDCKSCHFHNEVPGALSAIINGSWGHCSMFNCNIFQNVAPLHVMSPCCVVTIVVSGVSEGTFYICRP